MLSERLKAAFDDILRAIDLIEIWVKEAGGVDVALRENSQSRSAIERQLLVISEAAVRINKIDPAAAARYAPAVDWPGARGIGNFIRHKYDDLDAALIASVVGAKLALMRTACAAAIERLAAQP